MVTNTDLALVDFSGLVMDVQLNRFVYTLPPSIAKLIVTEKEDKPSKGVGGFKQQRQSQKHQKHRASVGMEA